MLRPQFFAGERGGLCFRSCNKLMDRMMSPFATNVGSAGL
jgi:hypothetical protein